MRTYVLTVTTMVGCFGMFLAGYNYATERNWSLILVEVILGIFTIAISMAVGISLADRKNK